MLALYQTLHVGSRIFPPTEKTWLIRDVDSTVHVRLCRGKNTEGSRWEGKMKREEGFPPRW